MLLLKFVGKDFTKYFKFENVDHFNIQEEERIGLDINLDFDFIDSKWHVVNKSDVHVKVGRKHLKAGNSMLVKPEKSIKYQDIIITPIDYKEKIVKKISPGLTESVLDLTQKTEFLIGRNNKCDIVIDNPQVDQFNTRIIHDGDLFYVEDMGSANGLLINGKKYKNKLLQNYDTISIPGAVYMLVDDKLLHSVSNDGIRVDVRHISKRVKDFESHKHIYLVNDVSLTINEGEYVAIVGGSGAGKSTFIDCVNGRRPMTSGKVYYDLNNYYEYYSSYQKIVGYVPQQDIMHTDLSVYKTLYYYAAIRMHSHMNKKELKDLIYQTLEEVSLRDKKDVIVSSLSGGQRKRVSIAMELLANPKVIFLDEPTSGLSPDLDLEVMTLLKSLSKKGKTIILITHNMENVDKCDKIAFLGKGGRLCYYGKPKDVFKYFGVKKYGKIFSLLQDEENVVKFQEQLKEQKDYIKMMQEQDKLFLGSDKK